MLKASRGGKKTQTLNNISTGMLFIMSSAAESGVCSVRKGPLASSSSIEIPDRPERRSKHRCSKKRRTRNAVKQISKYWVPGTQQINSERLASLRFSFTRRASSCVSPERKSGVKGVSSKSSLFGNQENAHNNGRESL